MTLNVGPLADRVVVEPVEEDVQTFGGGQLVLPDTAKRKPARAPPLNYRRYSSQRSNSTS
jgi:co-chaperonin GroES (HSP10)